MNRTTIIQALINKINAKSYLEIGISSGRNFIDIECDRKIGVDPDPNANATFLLTSDEFFEQNTDTFDVIFIDGLHHADQVYKDILNSLNILNNKGYIICHDINPENEIQQLVPFRGGEWTGDCWKAFVQLRSERPDLTMYTVDTDYGCGIIKSGCQDVLQLDLNDLTWLNLEKHRIEWLNLITVNKFYEYEQL
jgi:SAM-dependent methyltransferase